MESIFDTLMFGSGSSPISGLKNVVIVDFQTLMNVRNTCRGNPMIRTAVESLISQVIGTGISLSLKNSKKVFKNDDQLGIVLSREVQQFIDEFTTNILYFGFCFYTWKKSVNFPELRVPTIPEFGCCDLAFGYTSKYAREYFVIKRNVQNVGETNRSMLEIMDDVFVSVVDHPDQVGSIQSPMSVLYPHVQRMNLLWADVDIASRRLANPEFVAQKSSHSSSSAQELSKNPITTSRYTESDQLNQEWEYREFTNEADRQELELCFEATKFTRKTGLFVVGMNSSNHTRSMVSDVGTSWSKPQSLPQGYEVANIPKADTLSPYAKVIDDIVCMISAVLGVSKNSLLQDTSGMHAANTELELRQANDRVKLLQRKLTACIEEVFETIWKSMFADKVLGKVPKIIKKNRPTNLTDLFKHLKDALADYRITVSFNYAPLTTREALEHARDECVISEEKYAEYLVKLGGFPSDTLLSEKERDEMRDKLHRRQAEYLQMEETAKLDAQIKYQAALAKINAKYNTQNNGANGNPAKQGSSPSSSGDAKTTNTSNGGKDTDGSAAKPAKPASETDTTPSSSSSLGKRAAPNASKGPKNKKVQKTSDPTGSAKTVEKSVKNRKRIIDKVST